MRFDAIRWIIVFRCSPVSRCSTRLPSRAESYVVIADERNSHTVTFDRLQVNRYGLRGRVREEGTDLLAVDNVQNRFVRLTIADHHADLVIQRPRGAFDLG